MVDFLNDDEIFEEVKKLTSPLYISVEKYKEIRNKMINAMKLGLKPETRDLSSIRMYPSFVNKLPNGTECGKFLALDLGGTNYRVLLITLSGKTNAPHIDERTYAIPHDKMLGTGEELFDYISDTLFTFMKRYRIDEEELPLGFTFSFPCEQTSLNKAFLIRWTKGFDAKDVVGSDIVELLQKSINKKGLNVNCVALVNDTVGTLASCALENPNCYIGLIVGTGTNAAYIEGMDLSESDDTLPRNGPMTQSHPESLETMIINMEWGAFGEKGELEAYRTSYDHAVDKSSLHPGRQIFEKMVSGMYLGELVRNVLVDLVERKLLLSGVMPDSFIKPYTFYTKYLTETERDPPHLFYSTQYLLSDDLKLKIVEPIDCRVVRYVCELVSKRAAYLAGTGISAILHRLNKPKVTVGVDGSLYKFHPRFRERMTDIIDKLKPGQMKFHLRQSEDGSGKGAAAIVAAFLRSEN